MATLRQIIDDISCEYGADRHIYVDSELFEGSGEYTIGLFEYMCQKLWSDEMDDDIGYIIWSSSNYSSDCVVLDNVSGNVIITVEEE